MPTQNRIFIALVIMASLLGLYLLLCIRSKVSQRIEIKRKVSSDPIVKNLPVFIKRDIKSINDALKRDSWGSAIPLVTEEMKLLGIKPQNLTRDNTRILINTLIRKYYTGRKYTAVDEKYGKDVIDLIYTNLQIAYKTGPEYAKLQKQIERKIKNVSKSDIRKLAEEKYAGKVTGEMIDSIYSGIRSGSAAALQDDIHNQMQLDMQNQMQINMQNQMQLDMQNQMMMQMQLDMQNQMMMQMQMDMQNQMMMQMQTDMQNQMMNQMQDQMMHQQMDMQNTMHQSEMAITPMHDGGHMMDMNNMHMGGM